MSFSIFSLLFNSWSSSSESFQFFYKCGFGVFKVKVMTIYCSIFYICDVSKTVEVCIYTLHRELTIFKVIVVFKKISLLKQLFFVQGFHLLVKNDEFFKFFVYRYLCFINLFCRMEMSLFSI